MESLAKVLVICCYIADHPKTYWLKTQPSFIGSLLHNLGKTQEFCYVTLTLDWAWFIQAGLFMSEVSEWVSHEWEGQVGWTSLYFRFTSPLGPFLLKAPQHNRLASSHWGCNPRQQQQKIRLIKTYGQNLVSLLPPSINRRKSQSQPRFSVGGGYKKA
jgi:hypothetical protein